MFNADIVIIGLSDESKSNAKRKGTNKGPDSIRMASNEYEYFERYGKKQTYILIVSNCELHERTRYN